LKGVLSPYMYVWVVLKIWYVIPQAATGATKMCLRSYGDVHKFHRHSCTHFS